ncbi:MAG: hypothetical protein A4E48_00499 [Methanosaeta sp. PtaU1.Bin060]|jgi:hypothetical protein|nr:MAG: hypothetical protein A4E48_00499 [Methanosaeta sp. PtaU1.Bin060]
MRIRVISSREEIDSIRPSEKMVHLAFRASNVDFLKLMQKSPRLQAVQIPPSYMKTMSKAIGVFLEMQGVKLLEGDVWGHRKDIDEYFTVPDDALTAIKSLAGQGVSPEELAKEVQKSAKLGSDLINYIAKAETLA